ncbi:hypothetical protein BSIN_4015 [Burkholderia singularis]|uniref:Uncharacterized protein n=1 Tax=Burkholderia singularis TaxID=1503053 RepID=A0A238H755_9BURK|nr:hypothetical protein BSIN_4015 [Burkholderia singularis]
MAARVARGQASCVNLTAHASAFEKKSRSPQQANGVHKRILST